MTQEANCVSPGGSRAISVGIVGAGIAGLAAALGLARAGHNVEMFEKSSFANEIGAAINMCPNATRILTRWGFDFDRWNATLAEGIRVRNEETKETKAFVSYADFEDTYGYVFHLVQRVDLHAGLKELAISLGVKLRLKSEITDIDCQAGTITIKGTEKIHKDLLIVADGVHEVSATFPIKLAKLKTLAEQLEQARFTRLIAGQDATAVYMGQNAFRWQIPKSKLSENPATRDFLETSYPGINIGFSTSSPQTRLVWYPCKRGEMFNFTGIHPQRTTSMSNKDGWNTASNIEDLVDTYKHFGDSILEVCKRAEEVKLWPLYTQHPHNSWTRGKAVAIGDAIHAMMPHHGQGGGMALEDGACLEVLFGQGLESYTVPELLNLFQRVRWNRCSALQVMSSVGQDQVTTVERELQPYIDGPTPSKWSPKDISLESLTKTSKSRV